MKADTDEHDILPSVSIHYPYDGTFNNQKMTGLLNALLEISTLPNATYTVIVKATDFEHVDAEKTYHEKTGKKFSKVMGYLRVTDHAKKKSSTSY